MLFAKLRLFSLYLPPMQRSYALFIIIFFGGMFSIHSQIASPEYWNIFISYKSKISDSSVLAREMETSYQSEPTSMHRDLRLVENVLKQLQKSKGVDLEEGAFAFLKQEIENNENIGLMIWAYTELGFLKYEQNNYLLALPYFLAASKLLKEIPRNKLIRGDEVQKKMGYFFMTVGDYSRATDLLRNALDYSPFASPNYIAILNNLGTCYFELGHMDKAEYCYLSSIDLAQKNGNMERLAKGLGELAKITRYRKDYKLTQRLLEEDIRLSKQIPLPKNEMYAQMQLAYLFMEMNRIDEAKTWAEGAVHYAASQKFLKGYELDISKILLQIAMKENDVQAELAYRRKIESLDQQIGFSEGQAALTLANWQIKEEILAWELENEKMKGQRIVRQRVLIFSASLALVGLTFSAFLWYRRRNKKKNRDYDAELQAFKSEKIASESKLEEAELSLQSFKAFLKEKNNLISKLEEEIRDIKLLLPAGHERKERELNTLLDSHLMTHENWERFKSAFIAEQPEFYTYIKRNFGGLTESNLRIILLNRIGLSNQETAHLLGITVEAVKKAKQRLRKKFETQINEMESQIGFKF